MEGTKEQSQIPHDFGEINGTPIANIDTILSEVNDVLGKGKNPAVEYIITRPYGIITLPFGLGSMNFNSWGHSALRYTTPDGRDVVANVEAKEAGKSFIQIFDAKDYIYGTDPSKCGSQKGTYHRDMIGLRVENVNPADIEKDGVEVKFNLVIGPIFNFLKLFFPTIPEYGNCARWTSVMLLQAGLVTKICVWPTTVFIDMFENYQNTGIQSLDNMKIVFYEQPSHVKILSYGVKAKPVWFENTVAPLQTVRNYFYGDLSAFAHCFVSVPKDSVTAYPYLTANPSKPSEFRNVLNSKYFIITSVVGSILLYRKGYHHLSAKFKTMLTNIWRRRGTNKNS